MEWAGLVLIDSDFTQAKSMGYRPGLTRISDYWVRQLRVNVSLPYARTPSDRLGRIVLCPPEEHGDRPERAGYLG